ncbi:MAG TPA: hypothetical protein VGP94_12760 [Tepidisphaeraceae bacterium]|nr:hypothetical protein [Tepidisphaeraceae bacterium]
MPDPTSTPQNEESGNSPAKDRSFGFYPQFLVGLVLGSVVVGAIGAVAVKYPNEAGLFVWICVFAAAWICLFFIMRKGWNGVLFGFMIGVAIAYYVMTRIFRTGAFS